MPGFVEVVPELRAKVAFSHRDLLSLRPVREGLSLIVCKNVLLHFDEAQRINVLQMFHQALQPGGTLVMERTQKLPETLARLASGKSPRTPRCFASWIVRMGGPGRRTTRPTSTSNGSAGTSRPPAASPITRDRRRTAAEPAAGAYDLHLPSIPTFHFPPN